MSPDISRTTGAVTGDRRRLAHGGVPHVWDPAGPTDGSIASSLWEALRSAVEQAQDQWEKVVEHAASPDEAAANLAALSTAIRMTAAGREPDLSTVPRTQLSRRLVGLLRSAFVERVAPPAPAPDAAQLLRVLCAIERVAQRLEPD